MQPRSVVAEGASEVQEQDYHAARVDVNSEENCVAGFCSLDIGC